jgi:putative SOS response-associated peptidase YedK
MRGIHDRMPVIMQRKDEPAWLDPTLKCDRVMPLLAPYPTEMMEAYPVSSLVNSPANDRQECAESFRDSLF